MNQPIAGVAPPEVTEARLTTVWPSIGAFGPGRLVGTLVGIRAGIGVFTLGKVFALATLPITLSVYAWRLMPFLARRYTLTNRRVAIQRGLLPVVSHSIDLDEFDAIRVEVLPGHGWLRAGDLVFHRDGREVFRLAGVPLPEPFRQTCLKAQMALLTVRQTREAQMMLESPGPG